MNIREIERLIVKACKKAQRAGTKITDNDETPGCLCPLQCVTGSKEAYFPAVAKLFRKNWIWPWAFVAGFDNGNSVAAFYTASRRAPSAFKLGQKLRADLLGK